MTVIAIDADFFVVWHLDFLGCVEIIAKCNGDILDNSMELKRIKINGSVVIADFLTCFDEVVAFNLKCLFVAERNGVAIYLVGARLGAWLEFLTICEWFTIV